MSYACAPILVGATSPVSEINITYKCLIMNIIIIIKYYLLPSLHPFTQLKQAASQKQEWLSKGHGKYEEVTDEKEFFDVCKKSSKVVCHFYRDSTMRCKIVDKHLSLLAPRHIETKFVKLSVDRAPFLCERLKIRILPTISVVLNNITKDYIKGFDDLGGTDDFGTETLEWRLGVAGALTYSGNLLEPPTSSKGPSSKSFMTRQTKSSIRSGHLSSDEDDD